MTPVLPELAEAIIEERLGRAQMRYVAMSRAATPARVEAAKLKLLGWLRELNRVSAPMTDGDPR